MGVWMIGTGNISIKPQVDESLIKEYFDCGEICRAFNLVSLYKKIL